MENGIRHTWLTGPWHDCGICDRKTKLNTMTWQRGVLRCQKCVDKKLLGQRDVQIAEVLTDGKEEFVPAPKLRFPDHDEIIDDLGL
jgi:hypothetical protein